MPFDGSWVDSKKPIQALTVMRCLAAQRIVTGLRMPAAQIGGCGFRNGNCQGLTTRK
jgi:hypothetical protein